MAYHRYCANCGQEITCREERRRLDRTADGFAVMLFCPKCDRRLGEVFPTV